MYYIACYDTSFFSYTGVGIKNGSSTASDDKMTGTLSTGGEGAERSSTSDTEQDIAVTSERREDPGDKKEENTATFSTIRKTGLVSCNLCYTRDSNTNRTMLYIYGGTRNDSRSGVMCVVRLCSRNVILGAL